MAENGGDAVYAISGTPKGGETLSIKEISQDPDGSGSLSYKWQISEDGISWDTVGTDTEYTVDSVDEGKHIRVVRRAKIKKRILVQLPLGEKLSLA